MFFLQYFLHYRYRYPGTGTALASATVALTHTVWKSTSYSMTGRRDPSRRQAQAGRDPVSVHSALRVAGGGKGVKAGESELLVPGEKPQREAIWAWSWMAASTRRRRLCTSPDSFSRQPASGSLRRDCSVRRRSSNDARRARTFLQCLESTIGAVTIA